MTETVWTFYIDFYAENDTVGRMLVNDVRDIVGGRHPNIGRTDASIQVWDYRLATPVELFKVHVEAPMVDRARGFQKSWLKHWFTCRFDVTDAYGA